MISKNQNFNSHSKFIVIPSLSIGGAEKRFIDIFCALSTNYKASYYLIIPKSLFEKVNAQIKMPEKILTNIIVIGNADDSLFSFCHKYRRWLEMASVKGMHFHYPLNCLFPLHLLKGHHLTISLTNCYKAPSIFRKSRSLFRQRVTMFFAKKIDVLNSSIYRELNETLFLSRNKLSQTPGGTFVNPSFYSFSNKKPKVGVISRLIDGKGVEEFLDILPRVWAILKGTVPSDFEFFIGGDGPLSSYVKDIVEKLCEHGIPIKYEGFVVPNDFLKDTSIILSLQKVTNYPSRVVAESILSGCHVLVRDSGDSRLFGEEDSSLTYISEKLEPSEIALIIQKKLKLIQNNQGLPLDIRNIGVRKFSDDHTTDYFESIMSCIRD